MKGLWTLLAMACLGVAWMALPAEAAVSRTPGSRGMGGVDTYGVVATGRSHTCLVKSDGTLQCWGKNLFGQIGDGTTTDRHAPVTVPGLTGVVSVTAGEDHSCALLADGTVRCWGKNSSGQLGDGTRTDRHSPVSVGLVPTVVAVSAGFAHTCAIVITSSQDSTGTYCWGSNSSGQLGDGTFSQRLTPVQVPALSDPSGAALGFAIALTTGLAHTCALRSGGSVYCWGLNDAGQLGDGTTTTRPTPAAVSGLTARAIGGGNKHNCAIRSDGTFACWGFNGDGELGDGTRTNRPTPVTVASGLSQGAMVDGGSGHTCAVTASGGAVVCWGDNASGQLGNNSTTDGLSPVGNGVANTLAVAGGDQHSCAVLVDSSVRCWGANSFGQLGDGTTTDHHTPVLAVKAGKGVGARVVAAGGRHTCAVREDGSAACWGADDFGQLGNGPTTGDQTAPVRVLTSGGATFSNLVTVTAGANHSCALQGNGSVVCWGGNAFGELGDGTTTQRTTPVAVSDTIGPIGVLAISAGTDHTCAVRADGRVFCWGQGINGQLGNGSTNRSSTPVQVSGLTDAVAVAAGTLHTCARRVNGDLVCWGDGGAGELGNGLTLNSSTPVAVHSSSKQISIGAGANFSCSVNQFSGIDCWGLNDAGQLGRGGVTQSNNPGVVLGLPVGQLALSVGGLTAAGESVCALAGGSRGGLLICWGDNSTGQLGDGTTTDRFGAVPVQGLDHVVQASVGFFTNDHTRHTCAVRSDGAVFCWGGNSDGQLGYKTSGDQLTPAEVPSFRFNIDPEAALDNPGRILDVGLLVNCPAGQQAHVDVVVTQDNITEGEGQRNVACTGGLTEYTITVPAQGPQGFLPGAATAQATAVLKSQGVVVDTQHWTRGIELVVAP